MIYPFFVFSSFITELANCNKIVVGAMFKLVCVENSFGVAMLSYFDYTYASDMSSVCLPYTDLEQTSEGGFSLAAKHTSITHNSITKKQILNIKEFSFFFPHIFRIVVLKNDIRWQQN